MKKSSSFTSMHPASEIISKMEETAKPLGFNVEKHDFKVRFYILFLLQFHSISTCYLLFTTFAQQFLLVTYYSQLLLNFLFYFYSTSIHIHTHTRHFTPSNVWGLFYVE